MSEGPRDVQTQIDRLARAIDALEAQRTSLGDAVVDAAIAPLKHHIASLQNDTNARAIPASEPGAQREERRIITILFSDLVGSVTLAEKLDPEDWKRTIAAVQSSIGELVTQHQGMIAQYQGDALIAFFGAREVNECDAENAILAGLAAHATVARLNLGMPLQIRVGIHTGLVVLGQWGADARIEFGAFGDAVNVAARLQSSAAPGTVLISHDTWRQVQGVFDMDTLPPIHVKGKTRPLLVHRVLGVKSRPVRIRGLELQGLHSPLVGREAQLATANACIARLLEGKGGILSIIGEAGVGKSRLMAELCKCVTAERLYWLEGRTLSFGQTISYWPFREILHRYAGITEEDSEAESWQKLEAAVVELFAEETPEILPYLASLLTLEVRQKYAERVKYLDGEAMRHQLFLVARRFFERLAQTRPVVLVFEDLQWADDSSARLLEHLLPLVERAPLLLCGLSRPDPATPAARLQQAAVKDFSHCYTETRLTPLSEGASAQLMHHLLAIDNLSPRTRELIIHKAEGNPFFLEEIIRSLIDTGVVVHDPTSGHWRATAQVETLTIPDTVQGVILARIDRLDERLRQVLKTAAVIGRSFLYRVLRAIDAEDTGLDRRLAELQAIGFIREKQRFPELEYTFQHALVQETTYESILLHKRRELHAQVARVIESLFANRLNEFFSLLAYHYTRAEVWDKAQHYLLKAGDEAGSVAADAEALANYRQALDAYARAFGDRWDPVQRAILERKMGEALFRRGEHKEGKEYLEQALAYLGKPLPSSPGAVRWALLNEAALQVAHRLVPRMCKPIRPTVSPKVEEEIRLYELIGWMADMLRPTSFLFLALRTLNVSEAEGFGNGVGKASMGLGMALDIIPIFTLAERYHSRAAAVAERTQYPGVLSTACAGMGMHYLCLDDLEKAIEYLHQAIQICKAAGDLHNWGLGMNLVIQALYHQGSFVQALSYARDLVRQGKEGADPQLECWGTSYQGNCLRQIGRFAEAIDSYQRTFELGLKIPDYAYAASATSDIGLCYLKMARLDDGLAQFRSSQQTNLPHPSTWEGRISLLHGLAQAHITMAAASNQMDKARRLTEAKKACMDALKNANAFRPAMPEAMLLQGTFEWQRGKRTDAERWWQRSLQIADSRGQRYDAGMAHLEIGRRLSDRAHLELALAILAEIGAEFDATRARQALAQLVSAQPAS